MPIASGRHQWQGALIRTVREQPHTWLHRTVEVEVLVLGAVSPNLVFLALADTPGGATLPWRQHAALLAPVPAAVLLGLLRHVAGLLKEERFSELSINRAIEWHLNNMESQLHCHLRPVASVIVSLAAAHYYYPFIMGLGSASLMTRVFIGTRVVFIRSPAETSL